MMRQIVFCLALTTIASSAHATLVIDAVETVTEPILNRSHDGYDI